jgi:hypothetical protein
MKNLIFIKTARLLTSKSWLLFFPLLVLLTGAECTNRRDQLVLGSGGETDYQVILPVQASEALTSTAELIREAFAANGMELSIVSEDRDDPDRPGIYLGNTEFARTQGIQPSQFQEWGYLLKVAGKDLIITGTNQGHRLGVVKGVCDFLREHAGVRFLYPGRTGTEFLSTPVIAVPVDLNLSKTPVLIFNQSGNTYPEEWLYNIANNHFPAGFRFPGHMWEKAIPYEEYYHTHPEYFALIDGKRFHRENYEQYCISNPAVKDLIVQYLINQADEGAEIVYLGQPDAFRPCQCEECFKLYGTGDDWDEKVWLFHRDIAEQLMKDRSEVKVIILSYQATTHPPRSFNRFPDNTMIMLSHTYDEALEEWSKCEVPSGFTAYMEQFGSHFFTTYLPKRDPVWLAAQAKRFCKYHVTGLKPDAGTYCYGLEGPAFYVWGRMFDDPENNKTADLIEEFIQAAFAEAAGPMRKFYNILNRNVGLFSEWLSPRSPTHFRLGIDRRPPWVDDQLEWVRVNTARFGSRGMHRGTVDPGLMLNIVYTPDMVLAMEKELAEAEALATDDKVRQRIDLARYEFNYLRKVVTVNNLYNAWRIRPDKVSLERLLDNLDEWNDLLDSFYGHDGEMKPFPGWPEIHPFRNAGRSNLALITARWWRDKPVADNPFAWDAAMRASLMKPEAGEENAK